MKIQRAEKKTLYTYTTSKTLLGHIPKLQADSHLLKYIEDDHQYQIIS